MKALILNNAIVDTSPSAFEVHESMTWADCPDDCTTEWTLVNNIPTAPEPYVDTHTYAEKRRGEYLKLNQFELQFDDQANGTATWVDAINEIKERYPK